MSAIRRRIVTALLALAGGAAALAQDDRDFRPAATARPPQLRAQAVSAPASVQPWLGDDGGPAVPAVEAAALVAIPELPARLCVLSYSTRPSPLVAGAPATLFVFATLQDRTVRWPAAPMSLTYEPVQSDVSLGAWQPQSAKGHSPGFGEAYVHDEVEVLQIPLAVAATATSGSRELRLQWTGELHDGDTARSLGTFTKTIVAEVTVASAITAVTPAVTPAVSSPVSSAPVTAQPPPAARAVDEDPSTPAPPADADETVLFLGAALGALSCAVVSLLLVKKHQRRQSCR